MPTQASKRPGGRQSYSGRHRRPGRDMCKDTKALSGDLVGPGGDCHSLISGFFRLKTTDFVTEYIAYKSRVPILSTGIL